MKFRELFEEYENERTGCILIKASDGFMSIKVNDLENGEKILFIEDFFVSKNGRKKARHTARELIKKAQDVAVSMNCGWIRGIVHLKTINATESLKALLYYGCKAIGSSNNMVFVEMNVKEKITTPMRNDEETFKKGEK